MNIGSYGSYGFVMNLFSFDGLSGQESDSDQIRNRSNNFILKKH